MVTLTVNSSSLTFANALRVGQAFTTSGNLRAKTEFTGLGMYVPFDQEELDEIRDAVYVIYSYDTPIAWRNKLGVWFENAT